MTKFDDWPATMPWVRNHKKGCGRDWFAPQDLPKDDTAAWRRGAADAVVYVRDALRRNEVATFMLGWMAEGYAKKRRRHRERFYLLGFCSTVAALAIERAKVTDLNGLEADMRADWKRADAKMVRRDLRVIEQPPAN